MNRLPQRIVCLTTETVEVLYAIGEQDRIAGEIIAGADVSYAGIAPAAKLRA